MTVQAELCNEISSTAPKYIRALRRLLVAVDRTIDRFPAQKQRMTQLAMDGLTALTAVLLAYEMHFDFAAQSNDLRPIWIYALVMLFARPSALMLVTRYRVPWHRVRILDVAELSVASVFPSLFAVIFCAFSRQSRATLPSGILAMELPLFVGMATGIRCLRRAAYEENLRPGEQQRTLTLPSDGSLSPSLLPELRCIGNADPPRPATWDTESIDVYRGSVVLVTGAGGSVGSELCRKLTYLPISRLVLVDLDETAIFELDRSLEDRSVERVPVIEDVRNPESLRRVFEQHRPNIVLHAAAYKHVPLMEANPSAAILNNVIATRNLLDVAIEAGSERFLLISTDKAVEPSSVMGATKRIAELLVQSRAAKHPATRFACARFGNVLGSRGSVVPIFLRQIHAGKRITLTDVRMTRYFITSEQATDLALSACALGQRGEIYVLKSGEPIKIIDLASQVAGVSKLARGREVDFEITGIRPGEKLHECLWEQGASAFPTRFAGVYALGITETPADFETHIAELEELAMKQQSAAIVSKLCRLGIGYSRWNEGALK